MTTLLDQQPVLARVQVSKPQAVQHADYSHYLQGKPVIVGGFPQGRGVVFSASYAAREFGVHSAMPTAQALRLCPDAILIHPRHSLYREYSEQVMALLGVATNKLVAKIASALRKPHGLVVVKPGEEAAFLASLPIERLWGVGPATARQLHELGVRSVGQLAALPESYLEQRFGEHGRSLARYARGLDGRPVEPEERRKSISQENTFAQDVADPQRVERELLR